MQHNKETCLYLSWLNWWWHLETKPNWNLVTISLKLLKYNLTSDKGDAIYKTEHAISGARHLHNEDTSISASNVFDSLQLKAAAERSEKCRSRRGRGEGRSGQPPDPSESWRTKQKTTTACSSCSDATWPWQERDGGAFCPELRAWLWTHRRGVGPQDSRGCSDRLTNMAELTLMPCSSFALIVDSIC